MISTHRNHSYKAPSTVSPKKQNHTYKGFNPMKQQKVHPFAILLFQHLKKAALKPKMTTHTVFVWEQAYKVQIPKNMNLYHGIQQFYPNLYQEMEREKAYYDSLIEMEERYEDEAAEEYWAHQDYLEWLCD